MTLKNKNLKKIIMIVFSHYPADPRVRREAEALSEKGHKIDIVCLKNENEKTFETIRKIDVFRIMKGNMDKESIFDYLRATLVFSVKAFFFLNIKKPNQYDIVYVHNMPDFLVFIGILQKLNGKIIVFDLHDLTPELFISKWGSGRKKILIPIVKLVEKIACELAEQLITTSKGFYNRLLSRGIKENKIEIVYNSADPKYFKDIQKNDYKKNIKKPVIIYHGTIAKRFGIHIALQGVQHLKDAGMEPILVVLGKYDPSYKLELEKFVEENGLYQNVLLKGYYPIDKIAKLIQIADIGIVPYLSDPFMDLALSTKTFEYVLMRIPIVASKIDSIQSIFDENCITYFEPGNSIDLAVKIQEIGRSQASQKKKAENAYQTYRHIEWDIEKEKYVKLIENLGAVS